MRVSGIEYMIVMKPLSWGGGSYVQIKVELQKKALNCMVDVQRNLKTQIQRPLAKIEFP